MLPIFGWLKIHIKNKKTGLLTSSGQWLKLYFITDILMTSMTSNLCPLIRLDLSICIDPPPEVYFRVRIIKAFCSPQCIFPVQLMPLPVMMWGQDRCPRCRFSNCCRRLPDIKWTSNYYDDVPCCWNGRYSLSVLSGLCNDREVHHVMDGVTSSSDSPTTRCKELSLPH